MSGHRRSNCDEISNIQNYLKDQEQKLHNLEQHIARMTRQFGKREKALMSEIAKLHHELRYQTVKFDKTFCPQRPQTHQTSTDEELLPPVVEEEISCEEADETTSNDQAEGGEIFCVRLTRNQAGSLGFNIVGGNSAEPDCDQGVYVSRVLADCPDATKALQPYDRILKVNGRDVSQSSHHEAVDAFKTASDPVIVQVCRRLSGAAKIRHDNNSNRQSDMSLMTSGTQTEPLLTDDDDDELMVGETTGLLQQSAAGPATCVGLDANHCDKTTSVPRSAARQLKKVDAAQEHISRSSSSQALVPPNTLAAADSSLIMQQLELVGYIDDTDLDDECRQQLYELEYEEVTLRRAADGEKLGLTLCYGSGDNVDTDIFVGEIEPESVADKDGRIKAGDQILQINGVDVHTRNRAIELFAKDNADITLLLARSSTGESLREVARRVPVLEEAIDEERSLSAMQDQIYEEDDGVLTDGTRGSAGSAHEKDSGISRTTDSEPDLPPPINSSPSKYSQASTGSSVRSGASGGSGKEISTPENNAAPNFASSKSLSTPTIETVGNGQLVNRSDSESSLERELHNLHREMEFIQLECDRLIEQHAKAERTVRQQMDQANKLAETMDTYQRQQLAQQQKQQSSPKGFVKPANKSSSSPPSIARNGQRLDAKNVFSMGRGGVSREETSSAYNTGNESCRSTPLTISDAQSRLSSYPKCYQSPTLEQNEYETIADEVEGKRDSAVFTLPGRGCSKDFAEFLSPKEKIDAKTNDVSGIPRQEKNSSKAGSTNAFGMGDVMYTNPENLEQTILLQQRILRQAMIQQAHQLKAQHAFGKGPVPFFDNVHGTVPGGANCPTDDAKLEWKVKRRSDGTRYITRRPVRNKLLKERAQQLINERVGVSTDDDAMSELKIGRYWSKEERKKHLERAKERKKRQEELIRRQNETLHQSNDQPILQLSHKKMMRRQGQQLFDKFTTVQEYLSHGTRTMEGKRAFGLLSVTTV